MLRAIPMLAHVHQIPTLLTKQRRYQGHGSFRRIHKNEYRDLENGCSHQTRRTQARREKEAPTKNGEKQDQRGILKSRDNMHQNFSSIFDHSGRDTRRHSYFIRMISRTSSESDSSCNRVSNATGSVGGLMSFTSSSLNKDALLLSDVCPTQR